MIIEDEEQLTQAVLAETAQVENPRTKELLQAMIRHLHAFFREVRLTEKEFNFAIETVTRLGQLTTESHNETRLISGALGLSSLACLMNNAGTSANLLGPFWRKGAPFVENGGSIIRSPTPGTPLFFYGRVEDPDGNPIPDANVDVWHTSPEGLYENQDPNQADWNLRGCLRTDAQGAFSYRSVRPAGYPTPAGGPTELLMKVQHRSPFRPAHLHALIYKEGFKTIPCQVYAADDVNIESDAQFGVMTSSIGHYVLHEDEPAPDADVIGPWYSLHHTFVMKPGESWLPMPPVSGKSKTEARMMAKPPQQATPTGK